ncbi:MAG: hypothetical protein JWM10_3301 [Myxococcaceae bacterium]|nr:hypothetical protein [Myxococcaceae bacterium]
MRLALWAAAALAWCLPPLRHLRDDAWDYDEGPLLQAAALARDGARLYADVSLNKPPGFIWLLRAGFALGRPDVASARLAVLAVTLAGFLSLGLLADALFDLPAGLAVLAVLLCVDDLVPRAAVVMPDLPALSFAALALLSLHRFTRDPRARWWALSALAYAAAVATHPLVAGAALPLAALVLVQRASIPARRVAVLVAYAVLVLALVGLCVLPYDRAGMLRWMVRYNLAVRLSGNGLTASSVALLARYLRAHAVLVALALASGAWLARTRRRRDGVLVVGLWSAATLATFALWQPLWDNYYVWTLVPPAVLAGAGLGRFVAERALAPSLPRRARVLAGLAVIAVAVALRPPPPAWRGRSAETAAVVRDLRAVTAPGEYVASDDPFAVFAAGRRAPPPLADTSHKSIAAGFLGSAEAVAALRRYRVRVVLLGTGRLERMDAFVRAVRLAAVDRRVIGGHERVVIDPARLR